MPQLRRAALRGQCLARVPQCISLYTRAPLQQQRAQSLSYRAGAELEITLTLDERPGESEIDATEQQAQAELEGQTAPDTDIPDFGGFEGYGYDYDMD